MTATSPRAQDPTSPRDVITAETRRVAPRWLGARLASPWRRLAAIAIDGLLIATVANSNALILVMVAIGGMLLSGARIRGRGTTPRTLRLLSKGMGAGIVLVLAIVVLQPVWQRSVATGHGINGRDPATAGALAALYDCEDDACRQSAAARLATAMHRNGRNEADTLAAIETFAADVVDSPARRDALLGAAHVALAAAHSNAITSQQRQRAAAAPLATTPELSITGLLRSLISDLGIGFAWGALYFTLLPVWWHGGTPGKRLLGIRVISLSGERLGYGTAFARYGGYAAGLATGLLGYLQVFWDDNRQAIHDKIGFTAVVRDQSLTEPDDASPPSSAGTATTG